ncbi:MAG: class I adenylate-forming enzyme family protein [Bacilli bacterium]|nr:class I adenylate-forming enzyme family protein [Bacilli bacterium]
MKIEEIKTKVKKNIDKVRYEQSSSAPWLKFYPKLGYPKKGVYPECTIYELLERTAIKYPDYIAYEYFGKKATFQEFDEKIIRCAQSLINIGVTKNDIVTILMPNTPEAITMFYACNLVGAVANMVHPLSSEGEITFCLNKAKSSYILTLDALYDKITKIEKDVNLKKIILTKVNESMPLVISSLFWVTKGRKIKKEEKYKSNVTLWKDFIYEGKKTSLKRSDKKDTELAVILYSGGTTGNPKGIMHSSRNINISALQNLSIADVPAGSSILSIMPIFHGFGLAVCFHTLLIAGGKAIIIPKFAPEEFGKLIKTYRPNFLVGVPTLFEALIQTKLNDDGLSFVTNVISGGDMLTPELQKRVNKYLEGHGSKTEIRVGWGMTECVAAGTATPVGNFLPGSIGIPSPDNYVKIVKPGTEENVYFDTDGEICIRGPIVMMGYLDDKEETANTLRKHEDGYIWLHTGDMGSMDKNGMIFFKSRIKRMIISSGYNVYPNYIENVLNSHPSILTSIVVGEAHPYKGEVVKAFVVLKEGIKKSSKLDNELKEHCKKNLSKYMLPASIEYRDSLPQTKIGKADYRNVK